MRGKERNVGLRKHDSVQIKKFLTKLTAVLHEHGAGNLNEHKEDHDAETQTNELRTTVLDSTF